MKEKKVIRKFWENSLILFLEMMSGFLLHFFVDDNQNEKEDTDSCNSSISKSSEHTKSLIPKRISRLIEEACEKEKISEEGDQWTQGKRENPGWENSTHAKKDTHVVPKW